MFRNLCRALSFRPATRTPRTTAGLDFEALEDRQLLTATSLSVAPIAPPAAVPTVAVSLQVVASADIAPMCKMIKH